jgi:hypothetical protein
MLLGNLAVGTLTGYGRDALLHPRLSLLSTQLFSAVSILLFISRHYNLRRYRDGCFSHACTSWISQSPTLADQVVQAGGPDLSRAAFVSGRSGSLTPRHRSTLSSRSAPETKALTCAGASLCRLGASLWPDPDYADLPGLPLRWLRPVLRPECGFWVFGLASLAVA